VLIKLALYVLFENFLVTSLAAGRLGDIIGRRGTLFIGACVFTIGGAIQTGTTGFASMVVGRIVSGFGVGLLS
jgi:MFS family permease